MPDITVHLSDGSARQFDDADWHMVASCPPLQVRECPDGAVIVYAAVQVHGHEQNYGELLPPGSPDVTAAIAGVAFNYGIPIQCSVDCIRQVKTRRNPTDT
jgi:hypothetical protein